MCKPFLKKIYGGKSHSWINWMGGFLSYIGGGERILVPGGDIFFFLRRIWQLAAVSQKKNKKRKRNDNQVFLCVCVRVDTNTQARRRRRRSRYLIFFFLLLRIRKNQAPPYFISCFRRRHRRLQAAPLAPLTAKDLRRCCTQQTVANMFQNLIK